MEYQESTGFGMPPAVNTLMLDLWTPIIEKSSMNWICGKFLSFQKGGCLSVPQQAILSSIPTHPFRFLSFPTKVRSSIYQVGYSFVALCKGLLGFWIISRTTLAS